MDEWDSWQTFFASGRVVDYLRYKTMQNARNAGLNLENKEETDEVPNGWTDNQRTEYR